MGFNKGASKAATYDSRITAGGDVLTVGSGSATGGSVVASGNANTGTDITASGQGVISITTLDREVIQDAFDSITSITGAALAANHSVDPTTDTPKTFDLTKLSSKQIAIGGALIALVGIYLVKRK